MNIADMTPEERAKAFDDFVNSDIGKLIPFCEAWREFREEADDRLADQLFDFFHGRLAHCIPDAITETEMYGELICNLVDDLMTVFEMPETTEEGAGESEVESE